MLLVRSVEYVWEIFDIWSGRDPDGSVDELEER